MHRIHLILSILLTCALYYAAHPLLPVLALLPAAYACIRYDHRIGLVLFLSCFAWLREVVILLSAQHLTLEQAIERVEEIRDDIEDNTELPADVKAELLKAADERLVDLKSKLQ